MKRVALYGQVRRAVSVEGISRREAARRFGSDPRTVAKMLAFSVPPGYRRSRPPARPKLDPFVGMIDRILEEDKGQPAKQQHTAKRIFERLRDEHGYDGGISIVRGYVHEHRQRLREMFVPLRHDPGHAQVDFGEALAVIAGEECKIHFFAMDLPHSDACLVQAYPAESSDRSCTTTSSWRWRAFAGRAPAGALESSVNCSPTICSPTASGGRAKATIKARSRGSSATHGATSWCRSRARPASPSSMRTYWS